MSQLLLFSVRETEDDVIDPNKRKCKICQIIKLIEHFPKHISNKDNLDTRCKDCIKIETAIRKRIKATAPSVPIDGKCQCCFRNLEDLPNTSWFMDHCHKTEKFRGWLCNQCNMAIGLLGDDLEGIVKAFNYLRRSK